MLRGLLPHQVWAKQQLRHKSGLFLPCGTGKTLTTIRYVVEHELFPALIICRKDDILTWLTELELERFHDDGICIIRKNRGHRWGVDDFRTWTLITYDLVKKLVKPLMYGRFKVVIADESYMIKRWKTRRTKMVIAATAPIPKRIAVTATPTTQDVEDVFTQSLFMDGGESFGKSFWAFRTRYYLKLPHGGWGLRHGAKQEILSKFQRLAIALEEQDVLKLPPVRRLTKAAVISGAQRRLQESILQNWEYQLSTGGVIELNYVVAQLSKLRQVASGFLYDDQGTPHWVKSHKLGLLKELVMSSDMLGEKSKIVIWCAFTAEVERIVNMFSQLGVRSVAFYGKKDKDKARLTFKRDKQTRLFVGQADSGLGMNELIVADTAIYFSNSYRVLSRKQSEGRIRRKGSEIHSVITYYDLVTEDTVDVQVLKQLQRGVSLADSVLTRLQRGQKLTQILEI